MKKLFVSLVAMVTISASAHPYTIQPGDTFLSIANRHGVTYDQLSKANHGLDPDYIKSGFSIEIPEPVKAVNNTTVHPASKRPTQKEVQKVKSNYANQYTTPTGRTTITVVEHDQMY